MDLTIIKGIYDKPFVKMTDSLSLYFLSKNHIFLPVACSNASFSVGKHPVLHGYFLRNHLSKQNEWFSDRYIIW